VIGWLVLLGIYLEFGHMRGKDWVLRAGGDGLPTADRSTFAKPIKFYQKQQRKAQLSAYSASGLKHKGMDRKGLFGVFLRNLTGLSHKNMKHAEQQMKLDSRGVPSFRC
jgi:hypothetical protein